MTDILNKLKNSDKNLLVGMAGPGAGKSYTFKTIIESSEYKDKNILILSFINKLVDDLAEDFKDYKNVKISTLHKFALRERNKIKKDEKDDFALDQNLDSIISDDHNLINGKKINYESKFYEDNLSGEEIKFYGQRKNFYKHEKELYSFNSIIYAINCFFSNQESKIPKYDLILVDEFQDFNKLECRLIELLNKRNRIFLVGDDNQSLYYFKKAKPEKIRDLYNDKKTEKFSLDYCYRCPRVIVDTTNNLIANAKKRGYLKNNLDKKFLYPDHIEEYPKHKISSKYPRIDFIPSVNGNLLIYKLAEDIKRYVQDEPKRVLILVPHYLKQTIYDGLISKGLNIVDFTPFSEEERNNLKHKNLIGIFKVLGVRKTDNLALRKILPLYSNKKEIGAILKRNKKIWFCLDKTVKQKIETDIEIFKKVKKGKKQLNSDELKRFSEIFNLKNLLSRMIKGFKPIIKNSIEIEMTTVMSSKGLSADFVYYVGIDDENTLDKDTNNFSDQKLCEFIVGITRAKEKLTLISLRDQNPKIIELIDRKYVNRVELK